MHLVLLVPVVLLEALERLELLPAFRALVLVVRHEMDPPLLAAGDPQRGMDSNRSARAALPLRVVRSMCQDRHMPNRSLGPGGLGRHALRGRGGPGHLRLPPADRNRRAALPASASLSKPKEATNLLPITVAASPRKLMPAS